MTTLPAGSLDIDFFIHARGFSARLGPMARGTVSWTWVLFCSQDLELLEQFKWLGVASLLLTFKGTRQIEALIIDKDNHGLKPGTAR
jgi:hypothetical protein